MNFKKCDRCGCFFHSENSICPACEPKDNMEKAKLKGYFSENIVVESINDISANTGISIKNLNRFLENKEFSKDIENIKEENNTKINL